MGTEYVLHKAYYIWLEHVPRNFSIQRWKITEKNKHCCLFHGSLSQHEQIEHFVYTNKNNANQKIKKTHALPYTHSFGASKRPAP